MLLVDAALLFELTQLHPLLERLFTASPETSLAGGSGGTRGAAVNGAARSLFRAFAGVWRRPTTAPWFRVVPVREPAWHRSLSA